MCVGGKVSENGKVSVYITFNAGLGALYGLSISSLAAGRGAPYDHARI